MRACWLASTHSHVYFGTAVSRSSFPPEKATIDMEEDEGGEGKIVKTVPIIRDLSLNPSCAHGPTILFERGQTRFFTCSAYRSRKLCPFYMEEEEWDRSQKKSSGDKRGISGDDEGPSKRKKFNDKTCNPLSFPKQRDKGEAQYHFNGATVEFLVRQFENLGVDSILCVGTPSLHRHVTKDSVPKLKSFLLDIDRRFAKVYTRGFALYNMCNHYFFQESSEYENFLKDANTLAVVVDPPFGVKAEVLWNACISGIKKDRARLLGIPETTLPTAFDFWIFPYFMEGHILKCDPGLKMSDFHVDYENHPKFKGGTKNKPSPIRIFTTAPLSALVLHGEAYRYCDICTKWVDKQNLHCATCGTCTTKDGGPTYKHCNICRKCVKPSWSHCSSCKTCHLSETLGKCKSNSCDFKTKSRNKQFRKGQRSSNIEKANIHSGKRKNVKKVRKK